MVAGVFGGGLGVSDACWAVGKGREGREEREKVGRKTGLSRGSGDPLGQTPFQVRDWWKTGRGSPRPTGVGTCKE